MNPTTVQTIFLLGFAAYAAARVLPGFILKAAWCIMNFRTAVMGEHVKACPEGHFERDHYNSCKHRLCPLCAFIQVQKWLVRQKRRIVACDHYHLIFTIPHELNPLWQYNTTLMAKMLFASAKESILELLHTPKYLGATPGIIASLHTWTKTLALHPHIHCLVTGGGFCKGQWISLRYDYLFPMAVVRILFRAKVLETIRVAEEAGQLVLPPSMTGADLKRLLNKLYGKKWNVHIQEKYTHGKGVLTYLARYLKGGPISNHRIARIANGYVTFHTGRAKKQLLTITIAEFIQRFLQHVLPPGCVTVNYYGVYASGSKKKLNKCRKILGQPELEAVKEIKWQDLLEETFPQSSTQENPWECPICGKRLVVKAVLRRVSMHKLATKHGADPPCQKLLCNTN